MKTISLALLGCTAAALAASPVYVHADVTVQQKTALDVASLVHMHGAITTNWTTDKKREDTESHCEGMMSLVCGNVQGGEIVRLDRDVTWSLEPEKKRYREIPFTTPEELAAMRAKMQANLEKMRSCPATQTQQPVDKSKCQMSPPKIDVHKTDDKASIAGHAAQRTAASLTESCTNKDTGEVCDTVIAVDVWLTQDAVPGAGDRHDFDMAYAKKLGLTDPRNFVQGQKAMQFLAAYQTQIKQLTDKSGDFKGQPLKTSLRVLMGGPQCTSLAKKNADSAGGSDSSGVNPVANVAQAGKAIGAQVGQLMGGLFHKKKSDDSSAAASAPGPGDAAAVSTQPDPFAQYTQLAAYSSETVSISSDPIPAVRFDIPPNWTKEEPKAVKGGDSDYTCPKS